MKKFSVGNEVIGRWDFNVGIATGKFDTKQLILSSIAVLTYASYDKMVHFVRTVKREELAKCQLFINDDFTTLFPVIPSFYDVKKNWEQNSKKILAERGVHDEDGLKFVTESVSEKICNLEAIDCLMDLYTMQYNDDSDSFEEALKVTLKLIEKEIKDSVYERIYFNTVKSYV